MNYSYGANKKPLIDRPLTPVHTCSIEAQVGKIVFDKAYYRNTEEGRHNIK